jgi:hypothetical protein
MLETLFIDPGSPWENGWNESVKASPRVMMEVTPGYHVSCHV